MKNGILFLSVLFSFLFISIAYSQVFGEADKQRILAELDSTGYEFLTLKKIIFYNITEAIPTLESRFWSKSMTMRAAYLDVLAELNSPNTFSFALALIDSSENVDLPNSLITKLRATKSLFKVNDYSTANYIFDWLEEYHEGRLVLEGSFAIRLLPKLLDFPEYEPQVKQELIYIARNESFADYRIVAMDALVNRYGDELIPFLLERVREDTASYVRWNAFKQLSKLDYEELHNLIKERLALEIEFIYRIRLADTLLAKYGQPEDYLFLVNHIQNDSDPRVKEMIGLFTQYKKPPKLKLSFEIIENIDSLISYTEQAYSFGWIGDQNYVINLISGLEIAKSNILYSDSLLSRDRIKEYQESINLVFIDSLNIGPQFVLREGWNILYWNAQYILDRLPQLPVNADIEEINPAMSLVNPGSFTMEVKGTGFTTSSVIYFNGNARTTTFVADTLLTAEIQSTDVSVAGNYPVWVSDGTTNSDTLTFSVVSSLPKPVRPVLECVRNNGDGTYTAFFGYKNENNVSVYIPVGNKNKFTPTPQDRGQTRVFLP